MNIQNFRSARLQPSKSTHHISGELSYYQETLINVCNFYKNSNTRSLKIGPPGTGPEIIVLPPSELARGNRRPFGPASLTMVDCRFGSIPAAELLPFSTHSTQPTGRKRRSVDGRWKRRYNCSPMFLAGSQQRIKPFWVPLKGNHERLFIGAILFVAR